VDGLGDTIEAKVEFSTRTAILQPARPDARPELPGLRSDVLGFDPPLVPLMRLEENLAEKLARFRRVIKSRDVYDLAMLGPQVRASLPLIREMTCFKAYLDIARDGLDAPTPFRGGGEYRGRAAHEVDDPDDLGLLVGGHADLPGLLAAIGEVYGQMGEPQGTLEERLARLNRADLYWAEQQHAQLRERYRVNPPAAH
jgi:hypothetical protein